MREGELPLSADVLMATTVSTEESEVLVGEFAAIGLTSVLRVIPQRRSFNDIAWLALVAVPLKPFYEQLAKDFASDAHSRLKALTEKILKRADAAQPSRQVLLLEDSPTGARIVLEPDLPEEAFRTLLSFDLATIHRGPLHYDRSRRRWRSELDESEAPA